MSVGLKLTTCQNFKIAISLHQIETVVLSLEDWKCICNSQKSVMSYFNGQSEGVYLHLSLHEVLLYRAKKQLIIKSLATYNTVRMCHEHFLKLYELVDLVNFHATYLKSRERIANFYLKEILAKKDCEQNMPISQFLLNFTCSDLIEKEIIVVYKKELEDILKQREDLDISKTNI